MHKCINRKCISYVNDMFILNKDIHMYSTRQSSKFHVPNTKFSKVKKSIRYKGVIIWNYISDKMSTSCSIKTFKYYVRNYLFSNNGMAMSQEQTCNPRPLSKEQFRDAGKEADREKGGRTT